MIKLWSEITSGSSTIFKGHICFTKPFLLKMGCEIADLRFLKLWFFYTGFYCISRILKLAGKTPEQRRLNRPINHFDV